MTVNGIIDFLQIAVALTTALDQYIVSISLFSSFILTTHIRFGQPLNWFFSFPSSCLLPTGQLRGGFPSHHSSPPCCTAYTQSAASPGSLESSNITLLPSLHDPECTSKRKFNVVWRRQDPTSSSIAVFTSRLPHNSVSIVWSCNSFLIVRASKIGKNAGERLALIIECLVCNVRWSSRYRLLVLQQPEVVRWMLRGCVCPTGITERRVTIASSLGTERYHLQLLTLIALVSVGQ